MNWLLNHFKESIRTITLGRQRLKTRFLLEYLHLRFPWVRIGKGLVSLGPIPYIFCSTSASLTIGQKCTLVNHTKFNTIGIVKPCSLAVHGRGSLQIGNHVGLSGVSVCCYNRIVIEDDVLVGGNTAIFDTDFHSLEFDSRMDEIQNGRFEGVKTKPVIVKEGAFIGAYCIVMKGVTVGRRSIIGAGSVVVSDIPEGEIWAGSPARFIRRLSLPSEKPNQ